MSPPVSESQYDADIWEGETGLANMFLKQSDYKTIIISSKDTPGYIWNPKTCLWVISTTNVMAKYVSSILEPFLKNKEQVLLNTTKKSDKEQSNLNGITSLLEKTKSTDGQNAIFKRWLKSSESYIIPDIHSRMNSRCVPLR